MRLMPALALLASAVGASADMPATIERVKPSIVSVGTFRPTGNPQFTLKGTGFVIGDGNHVATNAHVVAEGTDVTTGATLMIQARVASQTQTRRARVVALAAEYDLALLRIEDAPLPALPLRDSNTVREGLDIGFTGFPIGGTLGFSPVTHRGMVSAITPIALPGASAQQLTEKLIRRLKAGTFNIFQLDATAYPGNSGSPVFDVSTGEVIAIINMVLVRGTKEAALSQPSGITYAIPANFLAELLRADRDSSPRKP
jgi:S1-C subfamily serine protease